MIVAVAAAPLWDKRALVDSLAKEHGLPIVADPAPALCKRYGFQTLYDMPEPLQGTARRELVAEHLAWVRAPGAKGVLAFAVSEWLADWMRWSWHNVPTETWEGIVADARAAASKYAAIHVLEEGAPRPYDGYAWLDRRNSAQLAGLLGFAHQELGVTKLVKAVRGA